MTKNAGGQKVADFSNPICAFLGRKIIGRPDLESEAEIDSAKRYLKRVLPEGSGDSAGQCCLAYLPIRRWNLDVEDAPFPAMTPKDLKDFLREKIKEKPISELMLSSIRAALPQAGKRRIVA